MEQVKRPNTSSDDDDDDDDFDDKQALQLMNCGLYF